MSYLRRIIPQEILKSTSYHPRYSTTDTIFLAVRRPVKPSIFLAVNLTKPAFIAKSVSSSPRLTLRPGLNLVPRCLTIICPGLTFSPANFFTPSLLEMESRPNWVDPPALRCAIFVHKRSEREHSGASRKNLFYMI